MRHCVRRIDADGRLSVFPRMQELSRSPASQAGRLLRFLLVRVDTLPAYTDEWCLKVLLLIAGN
jgi:hypothetical protein